MFAFLRRHAAVTGRSAGSGDRGAAAQRLLGLGRQTAEAHARDRNRNAQRDRLLRVPVTEHDIGPASLTIAL